MSGEKYADIQLERERKAQQQALAGIGRLEESLAELRAQVAGMVAAFTPGQKRSFGETFKEAEEWAKARAAKTKDGMSSQELETIAERCRQLEAEGRELVRELVDIREVKSPAKARELKGQAALARGELGGVKRLLDKWARGEHEKLGKAIAAQEERIAAGDFVAAGKALAKTAGELGKQKERAAGLEEQDRTRDFVIGALRGVCKGMGFKELKAPVLEDPSDPGSALLYAVDTFHAGKMTFRLTLKGIHVDSPLSGVEDRCMKDFRKMEAQLQKLGVLAKFEKVGGGDGDPKLRRKGELDLPDEGVEREREVEK